MTRLFAALCLCLLLVAACSGPVASPPSPAPEPPPVAGPGQPPVNPPPATRPAPAPVPAAPPTVTVTGTGVLVAPVRNAGYRWSPDGQVLAFQTDAGIWTVRADGASLAQVASGSMAREIAGWHEGQLVWLERRPGQLAVFKGGRLVATLPKPMVDEPWSPVWFHLGPTRLTVAAGDMDLQQVSLVDGEITPLGYFENPLSRSELAVSPDGRYLAIKLVNRGDSVQVLDLWAGRRVPIQAKESHLPGVAWSPVGIIWAARAAGTGSGLPVPVGANLQEGATHVVTVDEFGTVRRLLPPEPVVLIAGPFWAPDGRQMAVLEGQVKDGAATAIWLVSTVTGAWHRLGDMPPQTWLAGWHPDGRRLLISSGSTMLAWNIGEAAPTRLAGWAADTKPPVRAADGSYIYVTGINEKLRLYRQRPNSDAEELISRVFGVPLFSLSTSHLAAIRLPETGQAELHILPLRP